MKGRKSHIPEVQKTQSRMNVPKCYPWAYPIKILKERKLEKNQRWKNLSPIAGGGGEGGGIPAEFPLKRIQARRSWSKILNVWKNKQKRLSSLEFISCKIIF